MIGNVNRISYTIYVHYRSSGKLYTPVWGEVFIGDGGITNLESVCVLSFVHFLRVFGVLVLDNDYFFQSFYSFIKASNFVFLEKFSVLVYFLV